MKKDLETETLPNNKRTLPDALPVINFHFHSHTEREKLIEKNGKGSIYFTISYKLKRSKSKTTYLRGYVKDWNVDAQRFLAKGYDYENATLATIETDILEIYKDLKRLHKRITADILREIYTNKKQNTLKSVAEQYLAYREQQHQNKQIQFCTLKTYRVYIKKLLTYLAETKQEDYLITEIGTKFCNDFGAYLATMKVDRTRALGTLKRIFDYAKLQELVTTNPFFVPNYTERIKKELVYLSEQELYVLENYKFANDYLQKTADLFVFSCYTGFSYADMIGFSTTLHTRVENNGTIWIYKSRQKNGEVARLPLFPKAFHILEKYKDKLPTLSNQSYNANLKEIALLLNIPKKLTTHVARKTAGFVWLNTGLDYETVAAMLGHANIRITQSTYAKVLTNRIEKKLQEVNLALFIGKLQYDNLLKLKS
jgi:site-specific recombinase XerD